MQYPRPIKSESLGVDINIFKNLQDAAKFGHPNSRLLSSLFPNVTNRGIWPSIMIRYCCIKVHFVYKWYFACVSNQPSQTISAKVADQSSGLLVFPSRTPKRYVAWIQQVLVLGELIEIENRLQLVGRRPQQAIIKRFKAKNKDSEARSYWFGSRYNTYCVTLDELINLSVPQFSYP